MAMVAPPNSGGVAGVAALADADAVAFVAGRATEAEGDAPCGASPLQPGASDAAQIITVINGPSLFATGWFINFPR